MLAAALTLVVLVTACAVAPADTTLAEPFRSPYAGDDAGGKHVIALWQFDADAPLADASGKGHDLTLRGAEPVPEGRFGGALRSGRGWPVEDKPHQAVAKNAPEVAHVVKKEYRQGYSLEGSTTL